MENPLLSEANKNVLVSEPAHPINPLFAAFDLLLIESYSIKLAVRRPFLGRV